MSFTYKTEFPRTLHALVNQYEQPSYRGARIEAWLFEDEQSRRAAEEHLAKSGVIARMRSAYKPLLHFFLEDIDLTDIVRVSVRYPLHPNSPAKRFLLETYPLAALVGDAEIAFEAGTSEDFTYEVALTDRAGVVSRHSVFAPNRVYTDHIGHIQASPTGWLKVAHPSEPSVDESLVTDYQMLFAKALRAIAEHDWGKTEPYFEELNIRVSLPGRDRKLAVGEEVVSLHEAMHEDLYFSLLEVFQRKSGRPLGDRGLKPGHIVPEIFLYDGVPHLIIEEKPLSTDESPRALQPLEGATAQLCVSQIRDELDAIGGLAFEARSRSGRAVLARYKAGIDPAVMISGGQHPNETSGIVGALRAAKLLALRSEAHFTVSPLENPDGYALHQRLCAIHPHHMHHAARYTALGDDLEYRESEPFHERSIRHEAHRLTKAGLHVNLHGYPAHEWTRPLSGYVPRGFEMWTIPKGFFLILRHHEAWTEKAYALIDIVTKRLALIPGLVAFNDEQIRLYEIHAGETGFNVVNGFPCMISIDERHASPMTLITEYPDETIYGDAFINAHTAQMETVIAAYDAYQDQVRTMA